MPDNRKDFLKLILQVVDTHAAQQNTVNVVRQMIEMFTHMKADIKAERTALKQEVSTATSQIDQRLATLKDGNDYNLTAADKKEIAASIDVPVVEKTVETIIREQPIVKEVALQDTADDIRNKLELLTGDERLDKSAVKGLDELETQIKTVASRPDARAMTPSGPMLYVGGAKKGRAQTINLIAGAGISLSYNYASGRNDITISATGTVALTPITVTGTIDNSNTSFTAASTPSLVVINGASYRDGKGVTISGLNITTDNPVGTGGDIYAL